MNPRPTEQVVGESPQTNGLSKHLTWIEAVVWWQIKKIDLDREIGWLRHKLDS